MPIFKTLVWLNPGKIPAQAGFEPRIFALEVDALTSRPTRQSGQELETIGGREREEGGEGRERERGTEREDTVNFAVTLNSVTAPTFAEEHKHP